MKTTQRLSGGLTLVAIATLAWTCPGQEPNWYQAEREANNLLWASNMPIATLVSKIGPRPATDGSNAMLKLCVLMQAGMNKHAILALQELKQICPGLESSQISALYHHACDQEQAWEVAQALLELFAENVTDLTLENRLLKHWLETGRSVQQIDRWFADRPRGIDAFWIKERLRFAQVHGRGEGLLKELANSVRSNPRDVTNAIVFLEALLYSRQGGEPMDLSWFDGLLKPARAMDAKALGERLQQLESWRPALTYYQQAGAIALTEAEIGELGRMRQVAMRPEELRAEFAVTTLESMAECFMRVGEAKEAQQKLSEAAELRDRHNLRPNTFLAGRVQEASGQRTMEARIVEAEKKSDSDPEYWRERAMYFRGRQAVAQEEQALKRALALTRPKPRPERTAKGYADARASALGDYASFLGRHEREAEAAVLLRRELTEASAEAASSERAAQLLAFDFEKIVSGEGEVLWQWLAKRPKWNHIEQRLLWRMLENAPQTTRGQYFTHAEKLAQAGTASRALTLGWIMNRMGDAERSIPLLETAVQQATDEEVKHRATFALLESYLDTGAWKEAEAVFPQAARQLTAREIPQWHSRIALIAAEKGSRKDALRLWRRTANVSPTALGDLNKLASLGLRDDLVAFYRAMQKEMPDSNAPVRALRVLQTATEPGANR